VKFTERQRIVIARCIKATHRGEWYRAVGSGERVTLASLHSKGLLTRRVWRQARQQVDNAHEYKATDLVMQVVVELGLLPAQAEVPRGHPASQG
jgi:hypothetical protein